MGNLSVKRKRIVRNSIITALIILIMIVEGCFNFVTFEFVWERLLELNFWSNIASRLFLLVLVRTMSVMIFREFFENHNKKLKRAKFKNNLLMQFKDINFPRWIECEKNLAIRVETWKSHYIARLTKLNDKANEKDRWTYYTDTLDKEQKTANKYVTKRLMYEEYTNDKWLEENKNTITIKGCEHINPNVFDMPIGNNTNKDKYKMTGNLNKAGIMAVGMAAVTMLAINIIKQALLFQPVETPLIAIFIGLITDLILILMQFVGGISDAADIVDKEILVPYINRNNVLEEYIYYNKPDKAREIIVGINEEMDKLYPIKEE